MAGRKSLIIIRDGYGGTRIRFLVNLQGVQATSRNDNDNDKIIYKLIKLGLN